MRLVFVFVEAELAKFEASMVGVFVRDQPIAIRRCLDMFKWGR